MKKKDRYKVRFSYALAALLCVVILFIFVFSSFIRRMEYTLRKENRIRLSETSEHVAFYFQALLQKQLDTLTITANAAAVFPDEDGRLAYLDALSHQLGFEYIGIAGEDGLLYSAAFPEPEDISGEEYFKAALNGETRVTDLIRHTFPDRAVTGVVLSVPVQSESVRAVTALLNLSSFGDSVQVDNFDGKGYSYIIDKEGALILRAKSIQYHNYFQSLQNMVFSEGYSLDKVKSDISLQREGMTAYSELGTKKYAYYRPLGFNGWTVVSTVPQEVITAKTEILIRELALISIAAVVVFLFLFMIVCIQFLQLDSRRRANQAKSAFLANMSHDMRTPMNAIIGMAAIADAHAEEPGTVHDCMNKISLSSRHLLGLINDILDMSRIDSGKMTLARENLFLPEIVGNTVNLVYPSICRRHQAFSVQLHNIAHESLCGDGLRLSQVFTNVLSNALKFTPEGGRVTFVIEELLPLETADALFRFTFTDNGIGMKPEFLAQLFDPFSRENNSRVSKIEGSGLGMSITKQMVDLMNGTITVASKEGKGTVFTITIPFPIGFSDKKETLSLTPRRVLVAGGEEEEEKETVRTLAQLGMTAQWVPDGHAAIREISRAHASGDDWQAVLLDRGIYDSDGLGEWQELGSGQPLPSLILSAYGWEDIREEAITAGVHSFVQKPLFRSTLADCLRRLDSTSRRQAEPDRETSENFRHDFTGKNILLVEDNELNMEIAVCLLEEAGASTVRAENGRAAVDTFLASTVGYFDLILMDIQMPEMNGCEATRCIRSMQRRDSSLPIIAMSANAFAEDIEEAKKAGITAYLTKPIDVAVWMQEIEKYIL